VLVGNIILGNVGLLHRQKKEQPYFHMAGGQFHRFYGLFSVSIINDCFCEFNHCIGNLKYADKCLFEDLYGLISMPPLLVKCAETTSISGEKCVHRK
jgi:hypothetical protein